MKSIITFRGLTLKVEFDYQPEEKMVRYYSDGSGYPGCSENVAVNSVMLGEYDITELCDDMIGAIEDRIIEVLHDNDSEQTDPL